MRPILLLLALLASFVVALCQLSRAVAADPPASDQQQDTEQAAADRDDASEPAGDQDPADQRRYLRIQESDAGKPQALQTAVVRYRGEPGTQYAGQIVDLVGVVHIGQGEYYDQLNEMLAAYDTVLYELVAPDGTRIRPEDLQHRRSLLASMQSGMKDMLNLEYQLELVDYLAENFRHADMSPQEFSEDLSRRGDSVWKMVARMMGAGLASQAQTGGDVGLLMALLSGEDRSMRMKRSMARQLVEVEAITAGIDDADGENTLIKGRNRKAFRILREELDEGQKKVAVFYGAGHLPDMAERLEEKFSMAAQETTWLDAWDLTRN